MLVFNICFCQKFGRPLETAQTASQEPKRVPGLALCKEHLTRPVRGRGEGGGGAGEQVRVLAKGPGFDAPHRARGPRNRGNAKALKEFTYYDHLATSKIVKL